MVIPAGQPGDPYLMGIAHHLKEQFGIDHTTLLVATDLSPACALASGHIG
jgi:cobalt-zinc-cadmium efflux system protein